MIRYIDIENDISVFVIYRIITSWCVHWANNWL